MVSTMVVSSFYSLCLVLSVPTVLSGEQKFTLSMEEAFGNGTTSNCTSGIPAEYESAQEQFQQVFENANVSEVWTGIFTVLTKWIVPMGCYKGSSVLSVQHSFNVTSPKVGRCQLFCQGIGSTIFALQNTNLCKCFNASPDSKQRVSDWMCSVSCGEEERGNCGGTTGDVLSLYKVRNPVTQIDFEINLCDGGSSEISCPRYTLLHIMYANYNIVTDNSFGCPFTVNSTDKSCATSNSMEILQRNCEGKESCLLEANDTVLGNFSKGCKRAKKFLHVTYNCISPRNSYDSNYLCAANSYVHGVKQKSSGTKGRLLHSVPCNEVSSGLLIPCINYNKATGADNIEFINETVTRVEADELCRERNGSIVSSSEGMSLTNESVWTGDFREKVTTTIGDLRSVVGLDVVHCYVMGKNGSGVYNTEENCTENYRYICRHDTSSFEGYTPTESNESNDSAIATCIAITMLIILVAVFVLLYKRYSKKDNFCLSRPRELERITHPPRNPSFVPRSPVVKATRISTFGDSTESKKGNIQGSDISSTNDRSSETELRLVESVYTGSPRKAENYLVDKVYTGSPKNAEKYLVDKVYTGSPG